MRKILTLVLVLSACCAFAGCNESAGEKVEREVRNVVDDVQGK